MEPPKLVADTLAHILKVLGHGERVRLVEELRAGELDVNTLGERLGAPSTRVSQHLSLLRAHRIVEERRAGRRVYYHLVQPAIAAWLVGGLAFVEGRAVESEAEVTAVREVREEWSRAAGEPPNKDPDKED